MFFLENNNFFKKQKTVDELTSDQANMLCGFCLHLCARSDVKGLSRDTP